MASEDVEMAIVGISQDGGVPQAGCVCDRCVSVLTSQSGELYPVSCVIRGVDGSLHLIEATRSLAQQLGIAATALRLGDSMIPETVCLTHAHLGHIDGLGQFGKEAMGVIGIPLFASPSVIRVLDERGASLPFETREVSTGVPFYPSEGCGFTYTFVRVPHRDEYSDTHAIRISGPNSSLLFLPDHDDWGRTLEKVDEDSIRDWLASLGVGYALLDGTFWDGNELGGRDMSQIPHPTISDTLSRIGERQGGDPEIAFIHLNHTNPALDKGSEQYQELFASGWSVSEQGSTIVL